MVLKLCISSDDALYLHQVLQKYFKALIEQTQKFTKGE